MVGFLSFWDLSFLNRKDDLFLGGSSGCGDSEWQCDNDQCIDEGYLCDQVDDCSDASDESSSNCKQISNL